MRTPLNDAIGALQLSRETAKYSPLVGAIVFMRNELPEYREYRLGELRDLVVQAMAIPEYLYPLAHILEE